MIPLSDPHCRGVLDEGETAQNPNASKGNRGAPDGPQCPHIDAEGGDRYMGRKRGVDAGERRIGGNAAKSAERVFKRSVIDVPP